MSQTWAARGGTLALRTLGLVACFLILFWTYSGVTTGTIPWYEALGVMLALVLGGVLAGPLERWSNRFAIYRDHKYKWFAATFVATFLAVMLFTLSNA